MVTLRWVADSTVRLVFSYVRLCMPFTLPSYFIVRLLPFLPSVSSSVSLSLQLVVFSTGCTCTCTCTARFFFTLLFFVVFFSSLNFTVGLFYLFFSSLLSFFLSVYCTFVLCPTPVLPNSVPSISVPSTVLQYFLQNALLLLLMSCYFCDLFTILLFLRFCSSFGLFAVFLLNFLSDLLYKSFC